MSIRKRTRSRSKRTTVLSSASKSPGRTRNLRLSVNSVPLSFDPVPSPSPLVVSPSSTVSSSTPSSSTSSTSTLFVSLPSSSTSFSSTSPSSTTPSSTASSSTSRTSSASSSLVTVRGYSSPHPIRFHHKVYHVLDLYDTDHYLLDEDLLYPARLVLPPKQYTYLYRLSYLSILSGCFALYRGHYDLMIVPFTVFLTSINYWRYPLNDWRRTLDISCVFLCLLYQVYRSFAASNQMGYLLLLGCGMLCFPFGSYFRTRNPTKSALWHGGVHILGNISNLYLYSGIIEPLVFTNLE